MADGTYERRGPREAELKRLQRILDERRSSDGKAKESSGGASSKLSQRP